MTRTAPLDATPSQVISPASPPQRTLLFSLSLAMLLPALGTSIANVALPTLADAFAASFQAVQWVVLAYLLTITVVIVSVGRLGDLLGRRRVMLMGLAVFTLASFACGAAATLWQLVSARVVQGVGAAVMMAITLALVGELVPKNQVGGAMGLLGTVSAVGTALGPTLGGLLIGMGGWEAVFWINVPIGLVALVMVNRSLPPDSQPTTAKAVRFDAVGTVLLALSLAAYSLAMTWGRGQFGVLNGALLLVGLAGMAAFVWAESRVAAPLVRLEMFRHRAISTGFATSALVTTVVMATMVVGPFYLTGALGLESTRLGLVMSVGPAVAALFGAPVGRLVDRTGHSRVTVAGLAIMFLGTVGLPFAAMAWGVAGYATALGFITAGYATFQAANNTAVMGCAAPDQRGLVGGLLNLSRNLGLITGASVMGAVFNHGASAAPGAATLPPDFAAGLLLTFMVAAALVAMAMALALWSAAAGRRVRADLKL